MTDFLSLEVVWYFNYEVGPNMKRAVCDGLSLAFTYDSRKNYADAIKTY
jgi:hypothetical protein